MNNVVSVWTRFLYNSTVITIDRDYLNRNVTFPPLTLCMRDRLNETATEEFLKQFNKSPKSKSNEAELKKFLWNLAHFNISNLNELISAKRNFFDMENYLDVKKALILNAKG
jgi:Amiloride-sensitive sodium channel